MSPQGRQILSMLNVVLWQDVRKRLPIVESFILLAVTQNGFAEPRLDKVVMTRYLLILFLVLLMADRLASAEGRCPDGYFPIGGGDAGWLGCAPMGPKTEGDGDSGPPMQMPAQYVAQWGSIARGKGGAWGAVSNFASEESAKDGSILQCEESASVKPALCGIVLTYYNQCVVFVWGSGKGEAHSAIDIPKATHNAIANCSLYSDECEIIYSNCSYAKLVE
jgi:hypothetical protein